MVGPRPVVTLLEIGRIGKAHGLRGEVLVTLSSERPERAAPGATWFVDGQPIVVDAIRPHQNRWIVALAGVTSREAADALRAKVVSGEPIADDDAIWVHDLVGAEVATPDGRTWGRIAAVLANPADDLLELDDATLIPAGFIVDGSGLPERVVIDPPDGLLGDDAD